MDVLVIKILAPDMSTLDDIKMSFAKGELRIAGDHSTFGYVEDINGNTVGSWEVQ